MIRVKGMEFGALSVWRKAERYYVREELGNPAMPQWHGPLTDAEFNAFERLTKIKALDHEP